MGTEAAIRMDRMYRRQRHIYDLTRKYFLFGRDTLIDELDPPAGAHICEMGCGTARNLIRIARLYPGRPLYGIDASGEMLRTAAARLARAGLTKRVSLRHGLAQAAESYAQFGPPPGADGRGFDIVMLSYVLSMVPDWRGALDTAVRALRPGGVLHIVDFGDVQTLPWPLNAGLSAWLAHFEVTPRPRAIDRLDALRAGGLGRLETRTILGGYAILARFARAG